MEQPLGEQNSTSAPALVPARQFSRSGAIRRDFWINRKGGGTCWLPRWKYTTQQRLSQAEFLVPFGIERGVLDGCDSDEFGWQSGVEAVALLPSDVQAAAVVGGRAVVVVAHARLLTDARSNKIVAARCNWDTIAHPLRCVDSCCPRRTNRPMTWHSFFCAWNSAWSWSASWVFR